MAKRALVEEYVSGDEEVRPVKARKILAGRSRTVKLSSQHNQLEALPDELLLRILSFFSVKELTQVQSLSKRIGALTTDSQLWKQLYYERFIIRRFGRRLTDEASAERRANEKSMKSNFSKGINMNWKLKYQIRHKWSNGICDYSEIMLATAVVPRTFLCLRGSIAITFDSDCGLRAWKIAKEQQALLITAYPVPDIPKREPTALAVELDEKRHRLCISVGFSDGQFALYTFRLKTKTLRGGLLHSCFQRQAISNISLAGNGYQLLMSNDQSISLYRIDWYVHMSHPHSELLSSLKSQSIWKPVSINLRIVSDTLMASIIYAYPKFISGWSVGIQELRWSVRPHELLSTRLATSSQEDTPSLRPRSMKRVEYLPPTATKPSSLCYSHPYLLATHPDNTLSLYLVKSTESELTISPGMRLWGHTSDVYAANIGDRGKAATVAQGGDIRVWELEEGLTSALARKATPGPLVSVKLQPSNKDGILENHGLIHQGDTAPAASIDFDEERLVVLTNRGSDEQALYIYDFT